MSVDVTASLTYGIVMKVENFPEWARITTEWDEDKQDYAVSDSATDFSYELIECFEYNVVKKAGLEDIEWRERSKFMEKYPIEVYAGGMEQYDIVVVGTPSVKGHGIEWRDCSIFGVGDLSVPEESIKAMKKWFENEGLEWKEPQWHLSMVVD